MYVLDSGSPVTQAFMPFLEKIAQGEVGGMASGIMHHVTGYALAVAGIGFLISYAVGSARMMTGQGMAWGFIVKLIAMSCLILSYSPIAKIVFSALQAPSMAVMEDVGNRIQNNGTSTSMEMDKANKQAEANREERAKKAANTPSEDNAGVKNATHEIGLAEVFLDPGGAFYKSLSNLFFYFITFLIDLLSLLVDVIFVILSRYLLEILFALGPIAIAFSFFQPLEGSAIGWFKYVVVVSLWVFILSAIDLMNTSYGATAAIKSMNDQISAMKSGAAKDAAVEQMSLVVMALKLGLVIIKLFVPKIADVVISGSHGGNFFTAAAGAVTAAATRIMGGVPKAA
ncbi:hypothetical protein V9K67_21445 [Paraflavisolibacter sp. H34]|uniref:hypothetical protein n=1 Tax=Huijunlia imazamoxiresistens TaxID=3127457 RepID=UPI00301AB04C